MGTKLMAAMLMGVTLIAIAAMGASASGVLSADELGVVRAGCGLCGRAKYCPRATCSSPFGDCKKCDDILMDTYCDSGSAGQRCQPTWIPDRCGVWYYGSCFLGICIGLTPSSDECGGWDPKNPC